MQGNTTEVIAWNKHSECENNTNTYNILIEKQKTTKMYSPYPFVFCVGRSAGLSKPIQNDYSKIKEQKLWSRKLHKKLLYKNQ